MRNGAGVARHPHKVEVTGANPVSASKQELTQSREEPTTSDCVKE